MSKAISLAMVLGFAAGAVCGGENASAQAGEAIYQNNCLVCHGPAGDGKGVGSAGLDPKPRDFTKEEFKHKSTGKGAPPTDEDVLKIIKNGSPGTAMPPWGAVLSPARMRDVLAYIKTFNPEYWQGQAAKGGK